MKSQLAVVVTIGFSIVGVVGDYLLKLASAEKNPMRSGWFYLGFAVCASTAFGWVFVMRHLKLATIGVVYSISMILLLTAIGSLVFRESLLAVRKVMSAKPLSCSQKPGLERTLLTQHAVSALEVVGIVMAVGSLVLLMRFA